MIRRNFLKSAIAALAGLGLVKPQGQVLSTAEGTLVMPDEDIAMKSAWSTGGVCRYMDVMTVNQAISQYEWHDYQPVGAIERIR